MRLSFKHSVAEMAGFLAGFPYESGLVERLLFGSGESIKKEIAAKNFGCRHCLAKSRKPLDIECTLWDWGPEWALSAIEKRTLEWYSFASQEKFVLFDFNGLRSHLKAK